MKKVLPPTLLLALVLVCLLAAGGANGQKKPPRVAKLIEAGEFHGDEVGARSGEQWLGLYLLEGRSYLVPSTVTVEAVHDPVADQGPEERTGKRVSVDQPSAPVFLLRGLGELRPGEVATAFEGPLELGNSSKVELKLSGDSYALRVEAKEAGPGGYVSRDDARLIFEREGVSQTLYALGGEGRETEANWSLLWAGDLDGDDRLDLYVQVSHHYNISQRKLFLSSRAGKGRLVREVAEFHTSGC
jgi:hypothetical protein